MSVIDEIRELERRKNELLEAAKDEALDAINSAVETLQELGFHYRVVVDGEAPDGPKGEPGTSERRGTRRTGVREEVLAAIKRNPGVTRSKLLDMFQAKGDKSSEQSISNALSALKKAGTIDLEHGSYTPKGQA